MMMMIHNSECILFSIEKASRYFPATFYQVLDMSKYISIDGAKDSLAFDALQQLRDALVQQFTGVNTTSLIDIGQTMDHYGTWDMHNIHANTAQY